MKRLAREINGSCWIKPGSSWPETDTVGRRGGRVAGKFGSQSGLNSLNFPLSTPYTPVYESCPAAIRLVHPEP
jgi:hypothetical protein